MKSQDAALSARQSADTVAALEEVVTGRPHEIRIGGEVLHLYPVTLAKTFLLSRLADSLSIDVRLLEANPFAECLRLAEKRRCVVAEMLSIHTAANSASALHDQSGREHRRDLFMGLQTSHLAGLLMSVLTGDKTDELASELGIGAERARLQQVLEVKQAGEKNSLTFGGRSLFGAFIGPLKEMGYSDDEIVFERGYGYLRLMLADKVTSLYLSDEELERVPQSAGGTLLDGDDDGSLDQLAAMVRSGGERRPGRKETKKSRNDGRSRDTDKP